MQIQLLRADGSVWGTFDTDSRQGERLNAALLECYSDRIERSGDPRHDERIRADFRQQADDVWHLLQTFFPNTTSRIH